MRKVIGIVGGLSMAAAVAAVTMSSAQGTTAPTFALKKGGECLIAGSGSAVGMGSCAGARASWVKAGPRLDMLRNKETGTCLEAQGRWMKSATCDSKVSNQTKWALVPAGAVDGHPTVVPQKRYAADRDAVRVLTKWDGGSLSLEKEKEIMTGGNAVKAVWKFVKIS